MNGGSLIQRLSGLLIIFLFVGASSSAFAQLNTENNAEEGQPYFEKGTPIYADIDTSSQQVYVVLSDGIWRYRLETEEWKRLKEVEAYPEPLSKLEFGYDPFNDRLLFWSRGIGTLYEVDLETVEIERIDRSFPHNNQYGHYPFFRNGELHAFGGYGFWRFKNLVTFFNSRIKEWNIVTIAENSTVPDPKIPFTGMYLKEEDELYIYGGTHLENGRFDDKNGVIISKNDIWKFSFTTGVWGKTDELEEDQWTYTGTPKLSSLSLGPINSGSGSFYSEYSGNWYLPMLSEDSPTGIYCVKPYHIETRTEYDPVELPLGDSKDFIVSNFLFNPKSKEIVLVGLDHLTNSETLPLRVVTVSEDSLLAVIGNGSEENMVFIVASLFAISGVLVTIFLVLRNGLGLRKNEKKNRISIEDLISKDLLNESELKLIETLNKKNYFLETSELEEMIWPGVDNYDYRRKLRNEVIKSINRKCKSNFDTDKKLIIRKKDPTDHRRNHYGLNEDLFSFNK